MYVNENFGECRFLIVTGVPYLCDVVRALCSYDDAVAEFRLDETRRRRLVVQMIMCSSAYVSMRKD
jgi:hypothetical protein